MFNFDNNIRNSKLNTRRYSVLLSISFPFRVIHGTFFLAICNWTSISNNERNLIKKETDRLFTHQKRTGTNGNREEPLKKEKTTQIKYASKRYDSHGKVVMDGYRVQSLYYYHKYIFISQSQPSTLMTLLQKRRNKTDLFVLAKQWYDDKK